MYTQELELPVRWASYLVNGDASGLSAEERAECDACIARQNVGRCIDVRDAVFYSATHAARPEGMLPAYCVAFIFELAETAEDTACSICATPADDGEGYDGMCGNCADAKSKVDAVIEEYGQDVYDAAVACFGPDYAADALNDGAYRGEFTSMTHYAEQYAEDIGLMQGWEELAQRYFDFASFGRDMESSGDVIEHNGHVFSTTW
jgi:hypothetical protein